ncbi:MAG: hypothetical protein GKR98_14560 [Boseongicola sp.]|nr:MAG: hypothetical protein GKR98_14560 [Boseongicola sp.]
MARTKNSSKGPKKNEETHEEIVDGDDKNQSTNEIPSESSDIEDAVVVVEEAEDASSDKNVESSETVEPQPENGAAETEAETANSEHEVPEAPTRPEAIPATEAVETAANSGSGLGVVVGGVVAGALGFLIGAFALPDQEMASDPEVAARLSAQSDRIAALGARIDALPDAPDNSGIIGDIDVLRVQVAGVSDRLEQLTSATEALSAEIEGIESRPAVLTPDGEAALALQLRDFQSELDRVTESARSEIEEAKERASQIEADAIKEAELSRQRAAMAQIMAALESGEAYSGALVELGDVPGALSAFAEDGVPTMADLQDAFPEGAREVLRNTHSVPDEASAADRVTAFLKRQTNARSLSPRDGDDPDAVLSRAEAALNDGDIATAVAEVSALPAEARAPMELWLADAGDRLAATDAARMLSEALQ